MLSWFFGMLDFSLYFSWCFDVFFVETCRSQTSPKGQGKDVIAGYVTDQVISWEQMRFSANQKVDPDSF